MTEAILLVGGQGTRLRPVTVNTPKPMVPAAGVPFLAHQIARAAAAGVTHIVMATCYLAEVFEPYFGDGSAFGLTLEYVVEDEPLGTGGAIRNAAQRLHGGPDSSVLVFNGDILTGLDIAGLVESHKAADADVSLHLVSVEDPRAFGLVPTDSEGRVLAFTEKPQTPEEIITDQINAGCYVFRRDVIDSIPAGRPVSVERETFPVSSPPGPSCTASPRTPTGWTSASRSPLSRLPPIWYEASCPPRPFPVPAVKPWCSRAPMWLTARSFREVLWWALVPGSNRGPSSRAPSCWTARSSVRTRTSAPAWSAPEPRWDRAQSWTARSSATVRS